MSLRGKQRERRYPWWYTIKHSGLLIIRRLHPTIALGTQTIRLIKNMDFEIIAVVAVPPVGRRSDVLPEVLWHWKCFGHWELRFMRTVRRLPVL